MSNTKIFTPDKIKVGYQKRNGTYTKNLHMLSILIIKVCLGKKSRGRGGEIRK